MGEKKRLSQLNIKAVEEEEEADKAGEKAIKKDVNKSSNGEDKNKDAYINNNNNQETVNKKKTGNSHSNISLADYHENIKESDQTQTEINDCVKDFSDDTENKKPSQLNIKALEEGEEVDKVKDKAGEKAINKVFNKSSNGEDKKKTIINNNNDQETAKTNKTE